MAQSEEYVLLSTGQLMPIIGVGTWEPLLDTFEPVMRSAIDAGFRHFDTSFVDKNEVKIGEIIKSYIDEGKLKREDFFIVAKLPENGMRPENVEYFCKKSLSNLKVDYIDLYLIHSPLAVKRTEDDYAILPAKKSDPFLADTTLNLNDTWKAMEDLVNKGFVKAIGVCNFNVSQLLSLHTAATIKPANLQVECHAYFPQDDLHDLCKRLGIVMTAYSPLGTAGLSGWVKERFEKTYSPEDYPKLMADPKLTPICEKHGKSAPQVLLRYLIQRRIVAIPSSTNPEHMAEDYKVFDFALSDEEMQVLKSMGEKNIRYVTFDYVDGMKDHPHYPF